MQRFSFAGESPNSAAAALGAGLIAIILFGPAWNRNGVKVGVGIIILLLGMTQSRGAAVGQALVAAVLLMAGMRQGNRELSGASIPLFLAALSIGVAGAVNGRFSTISIGNGAEVRAELFKPGLMYLAERRLYGIGETAEFAEYSFFRYGAEVSHYQCAIIKHPLSSIVRVASEGTLALSLLLWGAWTIPIFVITPSILIGGSVASPRAWLIPLVQLYCISCAIFNDIAQDVVGAATLATCYASGFLWIYTFLRRFNYLPLLRGAACAAFVYILMIFLGAFWLRRSNALTGIDRCEITYKTESGLRAALIEAGPPNVGSVIIVDGGADSRAVWMCRQFAARMLRHGWRIIQLPGSNSNRWLPTLAGSEPTMTIFCGSSPPGGWLPQNTMAVTVVVDPSRVEVLSADGNQVGKMTWWVFTNEDDMRRYKNVFPSRISARGFIYCPLDAGDAWVGELEKIIAMAFGGETCALAQGIERFTSPHGIEKHYSGRGQEQ